MMNQPILQRYTPLLQALETHPVLQHWKPVLENQLRTAFTETRHGDWTRWEQILLALPHPAPGKICMNEDEIGIRTLCTNTNTSLSDFLEALHPWRKGPFRVNDVLIDAEWRSSMKWARLEKHLSPLHKRWVLDIGCGNGYYAWRMLGAGAARVTGIDPTMLHVAQFLAIKHLAGGDYPVDVLPIGIEDLPTSMLAFDTVFSMGVLYHRRSPIDHLLELKATMRPGGELVLETLVIKGREGEVLVPRDRYAGMRNVWFIPSAETLKGWLVRCGFHNIRLVDETPTTSQEQRQTDWMRFHSLADFLDPEHPEITREGHPAPLRAIFIANSPSPQ